MNDVQKAILEIVDRAYNGGDGQIAKELPAGMRGDGLADFLHNEVLEVTEGCEGLTSAIDEARHAIITAINELEDVLSALEVN